MFTTMTFIILLAFSAFFSASETALSSITKTELRKIKKSKLKSDRLIAKILDSPARMLTSILIGNNIVNVWASSIATAFTLSVFGAGSIGISTVIMTFIVLIVSEITPKTLAAYDPLSYARRFSSAITFILRPLYPFFTLFSIINSVLIAIIKRISPDSAHRMTDDELKTMMAVGKNEGTLEEAEHELLTLAIDFTELKLREIMTPRISIAASPLDATLDEVQSLFRTHQFSRMPVYEDSIDSIKGMIHYKDILFLLDEPVIESPQTLIRPILFVPETQSPFDLLKEMENDNQNMAIIIDEHGGTVGLVTIDDVLKAVFGGIHDEYDTEEIDPLSQIQILSPRHLKIPGNLKLDDLRGLLGVSFESDYYDTIGGFLMEQKNRLPARGESITYKNIQFTIEEQYGRKIQNIDILIIEGYS